MSNGYREKTGGEDVAKFEDVFQRYGKPLYLFLLSLTGDEHLAEDLMQETFYKAIIHIDSYKGESSMDTWLCQIGKNLYFNEVKRRSKFKTYELDEKIVQSDNLEKWLLDRESVLTLHKALHQIAEPYKEVFSLKVFGELKHKEIAEIFGKSEVWVKVTYYRAKEQIIKVLEEESTCK